MKDTMTLSTNFFIKRHPRFRVAAAATAACLLLTACSSEEPTASSGPKLDAKDVAVKPEMQGYFTAGKVEAAELSRIVDISGTIQPDERLVTRIGASVLGRVTNVLAEVGDRVSTGQPLASLASPELTQAQVAFLRAHASFNPVSYTHLTLPTNREV